MWFSFPKKIYIQALSISLSTLSSDSTIRLIRYSQINSRPISSLCCLALISSSITKTPQRIREQRGTCFTPKTGYLTSTTDNQTPSSRRSRGSEASWRSSRFQGSCLIATGNRSKGSSKGSLRKMMRRRNRPGSTPQTARPSSPPSCPRPRHKLSSKSSVLIPSTTCRSRCKSSSQPYRPRRP